MRVVIVGGGTFGASLAWWLAGRGDEVTLVDQFGPGDVRATSGGETRLIRCSHGADADYARSARRARTLWRELEAESGADLLSECGLVWFAHGDTGWEAESLRVLTELGIPAEREPVEAAGRRFPSFRGDDLAWALHEPEAGVLRAQKGIQTLARAARARASRDRAGARDARRRRGRAGRRPHARGRPRRLELRRLAGEAVPRTGQPARSPAGAVLLRRRAGLGGPRPAGSTTTARPMAPATSTTSASRPPGTSRGRRWIPTRRSRRATPEIERLTRGYLRDRFPALADAPLENVRTCRYELSPDSHFIAAPHPEHASVWILGGGSGHGFKHGPAMAERLAAAWDGQAELPPRFALGDRLPGSSLRTAGSNLSAS